MGRSAFSAASGAAALLTMLLAGCGPSTYGTGEVPEFAILREVTGGLGAPKKKPIEYQPRAPLVMPPSAAQLPAPVEPAAEAADVQWPAQS
jgi:hypothetical protein